MVVSELTGAVGNELGGTLMTFDTRSPALGRWSGVAGFAVAVDADPFTTTAVLGEVSDAWPEDTDSRMWPWASGTATVPAGAYSLQLWTGRDYCCYSRWVPAASPGLRFCELSVSLSGVEQTIYVTDIPQAGGACPTDPATAATGTVTVKLDGVAGLRGYQLLAGVFSDTADASLVGGAFWTIVEEDPYTDADVVHPPVLSDSAVVTDEAYEWSPDDYHWHLTAQLTPGSYRIAIWANPGELAAYGSQIPTAQTERTCTIDIDVDAGEDTAVIVTSIPIGEGPCGLAPQTATEG